MLCSATADFTGCADGALGSWSQWTTRFVQCRPTIEGNAVYARCFQATVNLDMAKETGNIVSGRPAVLICLDSALVMQLKVCERKDTQATDVRTWQGVSSILD